MNESMIAQALANGLERKLPPKPKSPPKPLQRGKGPRQVSDKEEIRNAFLDGIKSERIWHQLEYVGYVLCDNCPSVYEDFRSAKTGLDLHHTERRSQGRRYQPGNMGVDAPRLLSLVCRPCHKELGKSEPMWSKGGEG